MRRVLCRIGLVVELKATSRLHLVDLLPSVIHCDTEKEPKEDRQTLGLAQVAQKLMPSDLVAP